MRLGSVFEIWNDTRPLKRTIIFSSHEVTRNLIIQNFQVQKSFPNWKTFESWSFHGSYSGSVGTGSVGSWEPINIWAMGSGTHWLWAMETLNYSFYNEKQTNNCVSNYAELTRPRVIIFDFQKVILNAVCHLTKSPKV